MPANIFHCYIDLLESSLYYQINIFGNTNKDRYRQYHYIKVFMYCAKFKLKYTQHCVQKLKMNLS